MVVGLKHRKVFGENLRRHRKNARLSQEKLAELADLHPNDVGEVERGETNVSLDVLVRVARALEVRVCDLVADI